MQRRLANHDFDGGMENLKSQLKHKFPMLVGNYDFSGTPMEGITQNYSQNGRRDQNRHLSDWVLKWKGFVSDDLFGDTKYLDPIHEGNQIAAHLKWNPVITSFAYPIWGINTTNKNFWSYTGTIDRSCGSDHRGPHIFLDKAFITKNKSRPHWLSTRWVGQVSCWWGWISVLKKNKARNRCKTCNNEWIMNGW